MSPFCIPEGKRAFHDFSEWLAGPNGINQYFELIFNIVLQPDQTPEGMDEYDPMLDYNGQTAQLIAHILWYLVEGFLTRQDDLSFKDKNSYTKYSVSVSENVDEMVFYCSKKTGRWWVVVPIINVEKQTQQNYFLPCSLNDYKAACNDRISERWWRAFNKFNR